MPRIPDFAQKVSLVLIRVTILAGVVALLLLTIDMILLVFAGLLLAVFLISLAEPLSRYLKFSHRISLTLVILFFLVTAYFILTSALPAIAEQVERLTYMIPDAYEALQRELQRYEWGRVLINETQRRGFAGPGMLFSRATGVVSGTADWLVGAIIILVIGLYMAANPGLYQRGVVRLFPPVRREAVAEILAETGHALRWWLFGRLAGMVIVGVVTTFALHLMGVPLAGLLGLISGLLTFIPNLGPLISAIPVILIALMESPYKALLAGSFYTVLQMLEGYVLTPLIFQRTVSLPPALLLAAQAVLGSLLGLNGVAMAAPMTVIGMVLVKMMWTDKIEKVRDTGTDQDLGLPQ